MSRTNINPEFAIPLEERVDEFNDSVEEVGDRKKCARQTGYRDHHLQRIWAQAVPGMGMV